MDTWVREYVSSPHPQIGRHGPVCPFVPQAVKREAFRLTCRYDAIEQGGPRLVEILEEEIADFAADIRRQPKSAVSLECRLVVLAATGPGDWRLIDEAYSGLKDRAVANGLMIGQFHPLCDERAARNQAFRVSLAPMGLLAIRMMAPHDVLFLHGRRSWFEQYDYRFGSLYLKAQFSDTGMRKLYLDALERYGNENRSLAEEGPE
ncbi:MAG TPA: hypothetical protein VIY52_01280 [Streptosporangiaceae bacterium]